jgi:hypothetical protein
VWTEPSIGFSPSVYDIDDFTDLRGYLQSPRYFPDRDVVLRELAFDDATRRAAADVLASARRGGRPVVGITVRRGDYLVQPVQFVPLWEGSFYDDAIATLDHLDPVYLVSSDDPAWCRGRFRDDRFRVVEGIDDVAQMALLAMCDHLVVANSSFAWWAAWLNESDGCRVTAARWWGEDCAFPESTRDPVPEGWIELPV